jgi:DNA-3-methyladenine glycosylase I
MSYCRYAASDPLHAAYHDFEYGFPLAGDAQLFERLMLEVNQAGLSWSTILKKRDNFRAAYHGFDIDRVAAYGARERQRLLRDAGIVRNRLKVNAAIENARRILQLREQHGSFRGWLDANHPLQIDQWVKLFKQTFVFTGGEITREFLLSTGYIPGAHQPDCAIYAHILKAKPPWTRSARGAHRKKKSPAQARPARAKDSVANRETRR